MDDRAESVFEDASRPRRSRHLPEEWRRRRHAWKMLYCPTTSLSEIDPVRDGGSNAVKALPTKTGSATLLSERQLEQSLRHESRIDALARCCAWRLEEPRFKAGSASGILHLTNRRAQLRSVLSTLTLMSRRVLRVRRVQPVQRYALRPRIGFFVFQGVLALPFVALAKVRGKCIQARSLADQQTMLA